MAESRGMNIIRSGDGSILFRVALFDGANVKITAGATDLRLWHIVPTTGALTTYDFSDDTFKAGAIVTPTVAMTHRQAENSTYDTGVWTYRHTVLTGFTKGDKYIAEVSHASLPRPIEIEFQYGDLEGDMAVDIPDYVLDEVNAGHVAAGSVGLHINALGAAIAARANNSNLNALLGITDVVGANISWPIWDADLVAGHGTINTAGLFLRVLGAGIASRLNNPSLNAVLGVADLPAHDVPFETWEEVLDAAHIIALSAAVRLKSIDDLTKAAGPGDLAFILAQTSKIDLAATALVPVAGSIQDTLLNLAGLLTSTARTFVVSVNIEGINLRLEVGLEQFGILTSTPTLCAAQIFNEAGGIEKTIAVGDFGALNPRNLFTFTWTNHTLVSGQTYEILITITDLPNTFQTTKVFKTV